MQDVHQLSALPTSDSLIDNPAVRLHLENKTGIIVLDRPEARNAVNGDVASGIEAAIDRIEQDDSIWLGIITHTGPVFCAGADLKAIASGQATSLATKYGFGGLVQAPRSKPLIAALNGPALAGGCELALASDLIVATSDVAFGLPEVKRALVAAAGGLFRLAKGLPRNIALEMIMTGDPITAERAHHFGLVNYLVEPGEALAGARDLARRIERNAPLAVRASRSVALMSDATEEELWQASFKAFGDMAHTEDFKEGPMAFIEKRDPVWKGR